MALFVGEQPLLAAAVVPLERNRGANQSSTIVFPLPLDLLKPFLERTGLEQPGWTTAPASSRSGDPGCRPSSLTL